MTPMSEDARRLFVEMMQHIRSCLGTDDRPDSDSADLVRRAEEILKQDAALHDQKKTGGNAP